MRNQPWFNIMLLTVEQTNELLLRNHDLRLAGNKIILETNASLNTNSGHTRGRERRHGRGSRNVGFKSNQNNKNNPRQKNALASDHDKGKRPIIKHDDTVCNCYDIIGNWSRTCHTSKYFVDIYQASLKK